MSEKKETIYGLIVRLAGYGLRFKVDRDAIDFKAIPLKVEWPEDLDEKLIEEASKTIKKNKVELVRYVWIRDSPRHPLKDSEVLEVAKEIFGAKGAIEQKNSPDIEIPKVPY